MVIDLPISVYFLRSLVKKIERVLLVDDDKATNYANKKLIEHHSFANEIIVKTDAKSALAYLGEDCKKHTSYPNLIILDLKMPDMDGIEFLKEFEHLCKDVRLETVVVILSSYIDPDDVMKLKEIGHYYIYKKPMNLEILFDIFHRFFRA